MQTKQPAAQPMSDNPPFQTTEAVVAIAGFLKEMFPVVRALQALAVDVCGLRIGFFNSFHSAELETFDHQYVDLLSRFMRVYRTWFDTNELFKDSEVNDLQKAALMVSDYTKARDAVREHLDEGFRLLAHIDRVISDRKTTAYNRITVFLSLLAITISIVVAVG